jgi:hypothetical protein
MLKKRKDENFKSRIVGRVNCCWPSPGQSRFVPSSVTYGLRYSHRLLWRVLSSGAPLPLHPPSVLSRVMMICLREYHVWNFSGRRADQGTGTEWDNMELKQPLTVRLNWWSNQCIMFTKHSINNNVTLTQLKKCNVGLNYNSDSVSHKI